MKYRKWNSKTKGKIVPEGGTPAFLIVIAKQKHLRAVCKIAPAFNNYKI